MTSEIKIQLTPMGLGKVALDGHEVQNALAGFTINANAGEPVTLVARLTPVALDYVGEVDVKLPEPVRQVLLAAGWTPPAEPFTAKPAMNCAACNHAAHLHWDETARTTDPRCIGTGPGRACGCDRSCQLVNQLQGKGIS